MIIEATSPKLLDKAGKALRTADHMIYITYPLIKENKLLKSILEQIYGIADNIVNAILQHEWIFKRISQPNQPSQLDSNIPSLVSNSRNFELFQKCTERYSITAQETEQLKELLDLMVKHRTSSIEFTRKEKLVFMSNHARTESIGLDKIKSHLNLLKAILRKAKAKINVPVWQA